MPNQNTFLYPPLTFRILAVAILACLFLVPKTMADTKIKSILFLSVLPLFVRNGLMIYLKP